MKTKFNKRAFISLVTFCLSIVALITGIVLLIMPDATLAYWNKWIFLGLEKNEWEHFHAVISIYLTMIVIWHIIQNWKAMLSYMKSKSQENFKHKRELVSALMLSAVVIVGSVITSPISAITEVFEPVQQVWYDKKDEPPFEDAQALSLKMLSKLQDTSNSKVLGQLDAKAIVYESLDNTLEDLADMNPYSSKELYNLLYKKE